MGTRMVAEYRQLGIVGTRNVATGAHDRTQRLLVAAGAVATGVLLGHIRAGTDYRGLAHGFGDARIGAVVYFQAYAPLSPLDVHLPERLTRPVGELYQQLGIERRIVPHPRQPRPPGTHSSIELPGSADHDERRRLSSRSVRFSHPVPNNLRDRAPPPDPGALSAGDVRGRADRRPACSRPPRPAPPQRVLLRSAPAGHSDIRSDPYATPRQHASRARPDRNSFTRGTRTARMDHTRLPAHDALTRHTTKTTDLHTTRIGGIGHIHREETTAALRIRRLSPTVVTSTAT